MDDVAVATRVVAHIDGVDEVASMAATDKVRLKADNESLVAMEADRSETGRSPAKTSTCSAMNRMTFGATIHDVGATMEEEDITTTWKWMKMTPTTNPPDTETTAHICSTEYCSTIS